MWSSVSAVRALRQLRYWTRYLQSKTERIWYTERLGQFPPDVSSEVKAADQRVQDTPSKSMRLEHTALFALNRDARYGMRSRRWLFAKGAKGHMDSAYEEYAAYVGANLDRNPSKLTETDLGDLERQSTEDIMEL